MNKRVENVNEEKTNVFLLTTLILLFCLTLFISIRYIIKYHENRELNGNEKLIEIETKEAKVSIINNGTIKQTITSESFNDKKEIIIENTNIIEMISNNANENSISFDIKYDIIKNDFKMNNITSNKSDILVKFSYSYDNENWTYVNNVISTNTSNIIPLTGNNYDVAGLITTLNVATDFELSATNKKAKKMYWRSETIFKNVNSINSTKEFEANFTIAI